MVVEAVAVATAAEAAVAVVVEVEERECLRASLPEINLLTSLVHSGANGYSMGGSRW